jgi:hypothetical protein
MDSARFKNRFFRKEAKLLTQAEYDEQALVYTRKALREFRDTLTQMSTQDSAKKIRKLRPETLQAMQDFLAGEGEADSHIEALREKRGVFFEEDDMPQRFDESDRGSDDEISFEG